MRIFLLFSLVCCSFASAAASFSLSSANQHWQLHVELLDLDASSQKQQQLQTHFTRLTQALNALQATSAEGTAAVNKDATAFRLWQQAKQMCDSWWQQQQQFHCRTGLARARWQQAAEQQQLPDRVLLRQQQRAAQQQAAAPDAVWDLQGLLEAIVLDELVIISQQLWPSSAQLSLQLGQQRRVVGQTATAIQLPFLASDNPLATLQLQQQALVYANTSARLKIGPRYYSDVLQPKEGWPVEYGPAVAVASNTAAQAWLLAQTLVVLAPAKRQQFSEQHQIAALWHHNTGTTQASEAWYLLLKNAGQYQSQHQLSLQLELLAHGQNAKAPYLAVWLSKKGETTAKAQLALWGEQPRWYQELRSWWRQFGRQQQDQLQHWAGATRRAGVYQLQWNGRDLQGQPLAAGEYVLYLEIAREDGGREKLAVPLDWPAQAGHQQGELQGKTEFGVIRWQLDSVQKHQATVL